MTDQELVLAIRDLLSGHDWNADILQGIAGLLADNGYHVDDIADAPDDESAAEPRFMVPVKRDDGTVEPVYLPAYWDEDGNLRQRK